MEVEMKQNHEVYELVMRAIKISVHYCCSNPIFVSLKHAIYLCHKIHLNFAKKIFITPYKGIYYFILRNFKRF